MSVKANEIQVGGTHYESEYQHWDWVLDMNLPYLLAQISRYACRSRKKNGREDVEKALHYVKKQREEHSRRAGRNAASTLTFCDSNKLTRNETRIMFLISEYHCQQDSVLEEIESVLQSMLE